MAEVFDPFTAPHLNKQRPPKRRTNSSWPTRRTRRASHPSDRLLLKIDHLHDQLNAQAKTIADQREKIAIKDDAIQRQTEDIKRLDTELVWTRAALEQVERETSRQPTGHQDSVWQEKYLRLQAEMRGLKKRLEQRSAENSREEKNRILADMLAVADHLELAVQHGDNNSEWFAKDQRESAASYLENIRATLDAFLSTLKRHGVEPIAAEGRPFDPTIHEAVGYIDCVEFAADTVAKVIQTGYVENQRLLRPAKVLVSNG